MPQSIAGTYKNGLIQLAELPSNIQESKVIVTFLDNPERHPTDRLMILGMFSGQNQSTHEDFSIAEFHGDADDSLDWS